MRSTARGCAVRAPATAARARSTSCCGALGRELPEYVLQDSAVEEIVELVDRIDAAAGEERFGAAVGASQLDLDVLARPQTRDDADREGLVAGQPERLARHAVGEMQGQS